MDRSEDVETRREFRRCRLVAGDDRMHASTDILCHSGRREVKWTEAACAARRDCIIIIITMS